MYSLNRCHAKVQINNTDCNILSIQSLTKIRWSVYGNRLRKKILKNEKKNWGNSITSITSDTKISEKIIWLQSVVCFQQKALSISKIQYDGQLRISTQNSLKFCTYAGREL